MISRNKKITLAVIFILISLAAGVTAYYYFSDPFKDINEINSDKITENNDWIQSSDRINILLLGTDAELGNNTRTDTIILASIDLENKKISLLSIPRDTRVEIPGHGMDKINAANTLAGIELVKQTLSSLIKVPIHYYIMTNFEGFKSIVDTLGGVEIDVEQNMKYWVYDGMIDIKKGLQRLDGETALQYVRFRHDQMGDITRTQRQQKFLAALAKEMLKGKNLIKLPLLVPELNQAVETDLSIPQMISLAKSFSELDLNTITVQTLPGNFATINGVSYWCVDQEKAYQVVQEVFAGKSSSIIDPNIKLEQPEEEPAPQEVPKDSPIPDNSDENVEQPEEPEESAEENSQAPPEDGTEEPDNNNSDKNPDENIDSDIDNNNSDIEIIIDESSDAQPETDSDSVTTTEISDESAEQ